MNKARLESFSDRVFAFAITLLVLGIQVPELRGGGDLKLRHALIHSLSQLVPYVTSFATIGIIWLNHHELFQSVDKVDHAALTLNLLLLLIVSFVPYPTAILSRFGPCLRVRSCMAWCLRSSVLLFPFCRCTSIRIACARICVAT